MAGLLLEEVLDMRLLILAVLLTSCGCENTEYYNTRFDKQFIGEEFQPLYDEYKVAMTEHGYDTNQALRIANIHFVDKFEDPTTLASCSIIGYMSHTIRWQITVSKEDWKGSGPWTHKAVLFHELTHCVFGLDHSKIPGSIQNAYLSVREESWKNNWTHKVEELFLFIKNKGVED
jgi:hypothetical protein